MLPHTDTTGKTCPYSGQPIAPTPATEDENL
jgi:hypothetical protein